MAFITQWHHTPSMKTPTLIALFIFTISNSWSQIPQTIRDCFKTSFTSSAIYKDGWCNRNTKNLYLKCFAPIDIDGHVIYILSVNKPSDIVSDSPQQSIFPLRARNNVRSWAFHVILESMGHIFDLDYTQNPKISTVSEYFQQMFGVSAKNGQKMVIRVVPALEYAESYDDVDQNWNYYINNPEGFYSLQDVLSYLKNFQESEISTALSHLSR